MKKKLTDRQKRAESVENYRRKMWRSDRCTQCGKPKEEDRLEKLCCEQCAKKNNDLHKAKYVPRKKPNRFQKSPTKPKQKK